MLRALLVGFCRLILRIFFRRIEVVGRHHLPSDGAVLFALNHPSGLIDPLFILCLADKRVSFLAKEPLFRMPFISIFVKAFESLPVYRSRDGGDPTKNKEMMVAASELLARGNALALFPEGTSHSDTELKRFRSGAARIALSARALGDQIVRIVPAALYYERKETFRSRAVLAYGSPLEVPLVELDEAGNSPIKIGQELTAELESAVRAIMPTAENADGLVLAEQAERVLLAAVRDTPELCPNTAELIQQHKRSLPASPSPTLGQRMRTRRRLIDAYNQLIDQKPEEVRRLIDRILDLEAELEQHGLSIDARRSAPRRFWRRRVPLIALTALLFPIAAFVSVTHAPAYQAVRTISFRYAKDNDDVIATVKILAGLLFFPLTWLALGGAAAWSKGDATWLLLALLGPPLAAVTLWYQRISGFLGRVFAASRRASQSGLDWPQVLSERAKLAEDMSELLGSLSASTDSD